MEMWLAIASGVIVVAGAPFYLYDILKGKTKPQRTTWLIWTIQSVVAFASQALLHGGWSLLYIGLEAVGNIIVLLLALKYGVGGWTRADKVALIVAVAGVLASIIIKQPVVALFGVVLADFSGVILTLTKSYRHPESETIITWLALGTAGLLSGLSVGKLSFELLLYPIYLALSCYAVVVAIGFGKLAARPSAKQPN